MEPHRSGPLKQKNKPHKAPKKRVRHNSLNSIKSFRSGSSPYVSSKKGSGLAKNARKNQLVQLRRLKREEIINAKRGIATAPILIAVMDFSNHSDNLAKLLQTFDSSTTVEISKHGNYVHLDVPKFRTKYEIVMLDCKDLYSSIDLVKISDILLIIYSTEIERFEVNEPEFFSTLDAIYNHCLPRTLHGIIGLDRIKNLKQKDHLRRTIFEVISKKYPGLLDGNNTKLRPLDTAQDLLKFFHHCSTVKCSKSKFSSYCSRRSQVLAEEYNFIPNPTDNFLGTLQVDGFVRNNPLNVNSLIYIPEFGEFQIDLIETTSIPYGNEKRKNRNNENLEFVMRSDPQFRPTLEKENPIETVFKQEMQSQEEDMKQLEQPLLEKKKVPKGTSDYQAAWIFESDDDDDGENESNDNSDEEIQDSDDENEIIEKIKKIQFAPTVDQEDENCEDIQDDLIESQSEQLEDNPNLNYDQEMDMEEEEKTLNKFKEQRIYEMFPDEIDTPMDCSARERFAKYRGLKSFRTSHWDPKENLPPDYSRIFQFENFNRTRRRIFKSNPFGAEPGHYVRVHLINVPQHVADYFRSNPKKPLILYELLAHEHKMSVINIVVKKLPSFTMPIQSKERLIFHVGYRRFAAKPIFSAHTTTNKHKYEKYLRSDVACVATIYGPITYPPSPVLVYKEFPEDGNHQLVAIGSLLDCNPDRLIIKRYILSGHPYKINRRHAVVRYMFFNREDILWFRPVELRTKYGRHGHILEPLGTHGHMKCRFNHQLTSQDTILMYLYKRVFPKWYYEPVQIRNDPKIQLTHNGDNRPLTTTMTMMNMEC